MLSPSLNTARAVQDEALMGGEVAKALTSPPQGQEVTPRPLGSYNSPIHVRSCSSGLCSRAGVLGAPRAAPSSTLPAPLVGLCRVRTADRAVIISFPLQMRPRSFPIPSTSSAEPSSPAHPPPAPPTSSAHLSLFPHPDKQPFPSREEPWLSLRSPRPVADGCSSRFSY